MASRSNPSSDSGKFKPGHHKPYVIKTLFLQVAITGFFAVLAIKLFHLQVLQTKQYKSQALNNKQHFINIPAYRGEVYIDNGSRKIVENQPTFSIHLVPFQLVKHYKNRQQRNAYINTFSDHFDINPKHVNRILRKGRSNPYKSYLLKSDVSYEQTAYLAENLEKYPGLLYLGSSKRYYPEGEKYGHITGYVQKINSKQLRNKAYSEYHPDSMIGNSGIESAYDLQLRGKDGRLIQITDAKNRVKHEIAPLDGESIPGHDLVLTIDSRLQDIVYTMLQAYTGAVILTRVSTGEVLALYSYPSYDPNVFSQERSKSQFKLYLQNPQKPFLNRVVQAAYPPSSLFKIVVGIAALSHNKVDFYNTTYKCEGFVQIGPQNFKCEGYHGHQNMFHAIANSCNAYFYKMGIDLGAEKVMTFARDYGGLGKKTGIDLPYERRGRIPTHRWKVENRGTFWWDGDTANFSIGQGFLLSTVVQINTLTAAIAGGGSAYKPHLLKRYYSVKSGEDVFEHQHQVALKLPLPRKSIAMIQRALRQVVTHGTAKKGAASSLQIAGKTGTAQNVHGQSHSWFTGYAPYNADDPSEQVAITVFVEHGGYGSEVAAPFAAAILEAALHKTSPLTAYQTIMQAWPSKANLYNEWLDKRSLEPLEEATKEAPEPTATEALPTR